MFQMQQQRANQNQTSFDSFPACTMNLFLGPRARGGAGAAERVGASGSGNNIGNRSEVLFEQRCSRQKSPQTAWQKNKILHISTSLKRNTCA